MTMEITERTYVAAVWHMPVNVRGAAAVMPDGVPRTHMGDLLLFLYREGDAPTWLLKMRFRWYAPGNDDPDADDPKDWYDGEMKEGEDEASSRAYAEGLVARLRADLDGGDADRADVRGGMAELYAALSTRRWAHLRFLVGADA